MSQYKKDISYQTVLESSLRNRSTAGIEYPNNYSTGDIYGDVFATKSVLNSRYDMEMWLESFDWNTGEWGVGDIQTLHAIGRDYIGLGQCSNQLYLTYRTMDMAIAYGEKDGEMR